MHPLGEGGWYQSNFGISFTWLVYCVAVLQLKCKIINLLKRNWKRYIFVFHLSVFLIAIVYRTFLADISYSCWTPNPKNRTVNKENFVLQCPSKWTRLLHSTTILRHNTAEILEVSDLLLLSCCFFLCKQLFSDVFFRLLIICFGLQGFWPVSHPHKDTKAEEEDVSVCAR